MDNIEDYLSKNSHKFITISTDTVESGKPDLMANNSLSEHPLKNELVIKKFDGGDLPKAVSRKVANLRMVKGLEVAESATKAGIYAMINLALAPMYLAITACKLVNNLTIDIQERESVLIYVMYKIGAYGAIPRSFDDIMAAYNHYADEISYRHITKAELTKDLNTLVGYKVLAKSRPANHYLIVEDIKFIDQPVTMVSFKDFKPKIKL
jgi:hypothetical protein